MEIFGINNQLFEVSYDKEQLSILRSKIINNAATIKHEKYIAYVSPIESLEDKHIVYFKKKLIYRNKDGLNCYQFEYDEYKYPYIVTLIDMLLEDNLNALTEIYRPDISKEVDFSNFKKEEEQASLIMHYYFELMSIIDLKKVSSIKRELKREMK